ncbi:MAG: hypothetical protein HY548_04530 [Elusimicrobia bacterium]|nr:hypothetical protein [Elusimicrobiota bacterium]
MTIQAYQTYDCFWKVRILYRLPQPLTREFLSLLPDAKATVLEFSKMVASALDHLTLEIKDEFYLTGALGGRDLMVTFGKTDGRWPQAEIDRFEAALRQGGFGIIEHHEVFKN